MSEYMGEIRKISNGFVFSDKYAKETFFESTEKLFRHLLLVLEYKGIFFGGDSYGYVHVFDKPNETHTSPSEVDPA